MTGDAPLIELFSMRFLSSVNFFDKSTSMLIFGMLR